MTAGKSRLDKTQCIHLDDWSHKNNTKAVLTPSMWCTVPDLLDGLLTAFGWSHTEAAVGNCDRISLHSIDSSKKYLYFKHPEDLREQSRIHSYRYIHNHTFTDRYSSRLTSFKKNGMLVKLNRPLSAYLRALRAFDGRSAPSCASPRPQHGIRRGAACHPLDPPAVGKGRYRW